MRLFKERLAALILLLFSCTTLAFLPNFIKVSSSSTIGSDYFPRILLILLVIFSIVLVIQQFTKKQFEDEEEEDAALKNQKRAWVGWAVLIIMILYTFVVKWFGFIPTTIVAMCVIMYLLSGRKWYYFAILISIIFLIQYIFEDLMKIMLP